jgi:DNA polymerase
MSFAASGAGQASAREEKHSMKRQSRNTNSAGGARVQASQTNEANCPSGTSAAEFIPRTASLATLREAVNHCRGCPIYCNATQGVFGEGPKDATVMFVGEQPGDQEDRAGKPFVGPAGAILDKAMEEAALPRDDIYVTNAVKHFKWEPRGTRRLHSKPSAREVAACRPWLETEIKLVKPELIVCLGATAAQSLLGPSFRITKQRGQMIGDTKWAPVVTATYHPSALLRMPDEASREKAYAEFVDDLRKVAAAMKTLAKGKGKRADAEDRRVSVANLHPGLFEQGPPARSGTRHA